MSAEGEGEDLRAGVEELDLECAVGNGAGLADELVKAMAGNLPLPRRVDVHAGGGPGRLTVERDAKADRLARGAAEDEVEIAGVKAEGDAAAGRLRHCHLRPDGPAPGKRPLIQRQRLGEVIVRLVVDEAAGRDEAL